MIPGWNQLYSSHCFVGMKSVVFCNFNAFSIVRFVNYLATWGVAKTDIMSSFKSFKIKEQTKQHPCQWSSPSIILRTTNPQQCCYEKLEY